jgi:hypothetical protein
MNLLLCYSRMKKEPLMATTGRVDSCAAFNSIMQRGKNYLSMNCTDRWSQFLDSGVASLTESGSVVGRIISVFVDEH